uniref:Uncharacterized protein n=1 Tax=Lactuca sativa TaxID=4236 RepID=A0A9R1WQ98_LACSA|nr:hypothetical protein LSAT_V11C900495730 [Lactuca sativa]
MGCFKNFDSDDDREFISTFFNIVQHIHDKESLNVAQTVVNHDHQAAHDLLIHDYFVNNCPYNDVSFEHLFRLNKAMFLRISNVLEARYDYFKQNPLLDEELSFFSIQKCTTALMYLRYDITFDASDEYLKVSKDVAKHLYQLNMNEN